MTQWMRSSFDPFLGRESNAFTHVGLHALCGTQCADCRTAIQQHRSRDRYHMGDDARCSGLWAEVIKMADRRARLKMTLRLQSDENSILIEHCPVSNQTIGGTKISRGVE